ncbi:abortive infection family protein [Streptococcus uberis]|uniref:abortive infection family protein n=1 Tax=Streptococcus uberis TaxID=1349 RepID=UPI00215022FC|nr:abortive infection family protein [Streptococcus uberis]MCR4253880.1 abortive infection family protein [Streptococcus uberis]MCR4255523.1 abortive infection family protein [Streptococcus uberis]MCR4259979.1 abortive infection family protein [Streptococcus uberis]MCR4262540.1 abortive infection family protein [Streptococcus uberis]MCV6815221.1 abortive infection family protein [Streptococcus uberis]
METISPKYRIDLVKKIQSKLNKDFNGKIEIENYLRMFQEENDFFNNSDFQITYDQIDTNYFEINITKTLGEIARNCPEKLIVIAIDLGIETPDFIPAIPTFRNKIKDDYKNASRSFEKAFKNIEVDPSEAVGNSNSILESIIKEILSSEPFNNVDASKMTSKKLIQTIINEFNFTANEHNIPDEIKSISNALITIGKSIEDLRSDKTLHHGQNSEKYIIDDPLYAYFAVNSCATVGLFLINYYERKYKKQVKQIAEINDDDLPF